MKAAWWPVKYNWHTVGLLCGQISTCSTLSVSFLHLVRSTRIGYFARREGTYGKIQEWCVCTPLSTSYSYVQLLGQINSPQMQNSPYDTGANMSTHLCWPNNCTVAYKCIHVLLSNVYCDLCVTIATVAYCIGVLCNISTIVSSQLKLLLWVARQSRLSYISHTREFYKDCSTSCHRLSHCVRCPFGILPQWKQIHVWVGFHWFHKWPAFKQLIPFWLWCTILLV